MSVLPFLSEKSKPSAGEPATKREAKKEPVDARSRLVVTGRIKTGQSERDEKIIHAPVGHFSFAASLLA